MPDVFNGLMRRVAGQISYRAVRNHGTIGGSVALADPAADWPACLIALGASLRVVGRNGVRVQRIDDFVKGAYETTLITGDIIMGFDIPRRRRPFRWGFAKVARKSGAFANSHRYRHAARQGRPGQGRARRRRRPSARACRPRRSQLRDPAARGAIARRDRGRSRRLFRRIWTTIRSGCTRRTILRAARDMRAQ